MTIKATEVNKIFRYATFFDLSASNALELKFTDPGGIITIITNPRVTAPAIQVTDPDLGVLAASSYMQFNTLATDFPIPGTWTVCGTYTDIIPSEFFGNDATFTVGEAC